jgi:aryl-alcohol dehydrogenase-like predicted oxidoreductase
MAIQSRRVRAANPRHPHRGVNFVDTAETYSDGESEEIVGNALRDRRDEVVLEGAFSDG